MTTIRQSYKAAKYHKKLTIIFSLLFGMSLFLLTFVSQLLSTQATTLDNVSIINENMKENFPQMSLVIGDGFSKNNHYLIQIYHHLYIILLFLCFFVFLVFGVLSTKFRQYEIKSLYQMGISKLKMIKYLLFELLIPILVTSFIMSLLFIVAQQQIINLSFSTNHYVLTHYFDEAEYSEITPKKEITATKQTVTESAESSKLLIPYNRRSAFDIPSKSQPIGRSFLSFIKSMFKLIIVTLLGSLVGFYSYIVFNFRRRRFFSL